jgi:hypothetical protein
MLVMVRKVAPIKTTRAVTKMNFRAISSGRLGRLDTEPAVLLVPFGMRAERLEVQLPNPDPFPSAIGHGNRSE